MKPITVATVVAQDPETVYRFLDCLSAHQHFNDHMLCDWAPSGPTRGVGAKLQAVAAVGGRRESVEIEVVEADPPRRIVERNIGRGGRRIAYGTYQLDPDPQDRTEITFRYSVAVAPVIERLLAPVVRPVMRRALNESMRRLHAQLSVPPQSARQARRSEEAA